jgi:hypothetical protein
MSRTFAKLTLERGMTLVKREEKPESIRVRLPGVKSKEFSFIAYGKAGAVIAAKKHITKLMRSGEVTFKTPQGSVYKHSDGRRYVAKFGTKSVSFGYTKFGGVRKAKAAADAWLKSIV